MAFTSSITDRTIWGNMRIHYGKFLTEGTEGGNINTGLRTVFGFIPTPYIRPFEDTGGEFVGDNSETGQLSGAWVSLSGALNTFPVTSGGGTVEVGIVTLDHTSGQWIAFGR